MSTLPLPLVQASDRPTALRFQPAYGRAVPRAAPYRLYPQGSSGPRRRSLRAPPPPTGAAKAQIARVCQAGRRRFPLSFAFNLPHRRALAHPQRDAAERSLKSNVGRRAWIPGGEAVLPANGGQIASFPQRRRIRGVGRAGVVGVVGVTDVVEVVDAVDVGGSLHPTRPSRPTPPIRHHADSSACFPCSTSSCRRSAPRRPMPWQN